MRARTRWLGLGSLVVTLAAPPPSSAAPVLETAPTAAGPWQVDPLAPIHEPEPGKFWVVIDPVAGPATQFYRLVVDGVSGPVEARSLTPLSAGGFVIAYEAAPFQEVLTVLLPGEVPLELVRIPAGSFWMGSTEGEPGRPPGATEQPLHEVILDRDFYLARYEVTQAQWLALMPANPSGFAGNPHNPVEQVSWAASQQFIDRLSALGEGVFRLPSEAEWEYACRAGTLTRFSFGESADCDEGTEDCAAGVLPGNRSDYMWWEGNSGYAPHPVGLRLPNLWGLHDMHGNVYEWVEDDWHWDYFGAPEDGAAWVDAPRDTIRVARGGSWGSGAWYCRSARRHAVLGGSPADVVGFRVVRELD